MRTVVSTSVTKAVLSVSMSLLTSLLIYLGNEYYLTKSGYLLQSVWGPSVMACVEAGEQFAGIDPLFPP